MEQPVWGALRVGDTEHLMFRVGTLSLAHTAQVIVGAHQALEAGTVDGLLTAITGHARVVDTLILGSRALNL